MDINIVYQAAGLCVVGAVTNNTIGEAYPKAQKFIDMALAIVGTAWSLTWIMDFINMLPSMFGNLMRLF